MRKIKNVLVPVSFAPSCKKAMDLAARIAAESNAKLHVLNVYKATTPVSYNTGFNLVPSSLEREKTENMQRLDKFVKKELDRLKLSLEVEEIEVEDRHPIDAIIKVAREKKADLIVLGHHEESRLEHLLFGRNIHRIVDEAPCDVVVTRTDLSENYSEVRRAA